MDAIKIKQKVDELRKFYGLAEPNKLAIYSGIQLIYSANLQTVLGMYTKVNGYPFIFINDKLDETMQKLILAHELGHALLHSNEIEQDIFTSNDLSSLSQKIIVNYEKEANLFAAFLLINQESFKESIEQGMSLEQIAKCLCICPEIIMYYCRALRNEPSLLAIYDMSLVQLKNLANIQQTVGFWQNYHK